MRAEPFIRRLRGLQAEHPTKVLGRRGERAAARYLRRRGYRILQRNLTLPSGEIDILAADPDRRTIVIVEVKTRRLLPDADPRRRPERNITAHKKRKLISLAHTLARRRAWTDTPMRIDVVAVEFPSRGKPTIRHHPAAVRD